jgi:hypothetical protein
MEATSPPAPPAGNPPANGAPDPSTAARLKAVLVVAVVAAIAAFIDSKVKVKVHVEDDFAVFAVFYVVAQAVERLVQPFLEPVKAAPLTNAKKELKVAKDAVAAVRTSESANPAALETAAQAEGAAHATLDAIQSYRALWGWAIATGFALIVCGFLGLGLIEAVASVEGGDAFFQRVDVIVTGLAIGAGTKPLHDLISRLEKSKQNADPATKPSA